MTLQERGPRRHRGGAQRQSGRKSLARRTLESVEREQRALPRPELLVTSRRVIARDAHATATWHGALSRTDLKSAIESSIMLTAAHMHR